MENHVGRTFLELNLFKKLATLLNVQLTRSKTLNKGTFRKKDFFEECGSLTYCHSLKNWCVGRTQIKTCSF